MPDSDSGHRSSNLCPGATALSSRGLGRRPLTAVTRVRIPLGLIAKTLVLRGFFRCQRLARAVALTNLSQTLGHEFVERRRGGFVAISVDDQVAVHRDRDGRMTEALGDDFDRDSGFREQRGVSVPEIVK